jgi:HEAT repeat protein
LEELGADASPALPALIRVLADQNVCRGENDCHWPWQHTVSDVAAAALVKIGRPAVPALIGALASPDGTVRWKAADVLGQIGAPAASAEFALAECVRAEQNEARRKIMSWALRRIRAKAARRKAVPGRKRSHRRGEGT